MHQWVHFSHWKSLGNRLCTWKECTRAPEGRLSLCAHHALPFFFKHSSQIIDSFLSTLYPAFQTFSCASSLQLSSVMFLCCSNESVKGGMCLAAHWTQWASRRAGHPYNVSVYVNVLAEACWHVCMCPCVCVLCCVWVCSLTRVCVHSRDLLL